MVTARNILVGYDGTDAGRRALAAAADLAGYACTVSVAAISSGNGAAVETSVLLGEAREELLRRHVLGRYLDSSGNPAEVLVEKARELRADIVVVGRDASGSATVGRHAPCDVLIVT
jgi:nucleotide-binding universal stress UspA family protein